MTHIGIYWFRNDLRLHDNLGLLQASQDCQYLIPVYCHIHPTQNQWGFSNYGQLRQQLIYSCIQDLQNRLQEKSSDLIELSGTAVQQIAQLAKQYQIQDIYCESIHAPYELAEIDELKKLGFNVHCYWQSSLLAIEDLPFKLENLPDVFTQFRQKIEHPQVRPRPPQSAITRLPSLPSDFTHKSHASTLSIQSAHPHSSFPFQNWNHYGESQALIQLNEYFNSPQPHNYKQTRNQLTGWNYSTKFSVWLACGALSPRQLFDALKKFEAEYGESESSYWIWFELLWRDYFRFLHFKYGKQLYRATGLFSSAHRVVNNENFKAWCLGETGQTLIDAAMRELNQTGFLSNRLRQIVASYLIYNLKVDWRLGAAWFESQLLDYDVYSNQGNWLYIAGYGTDPRGGRAFDIQKQAKLYDPNGEYQKLWTTKNHQ